MKRSRKARRADAEAPPRPPLPGADARVTRVGDLVFLSWSASAPAPLTPAEAATIALVLEGRSNREVAEVRGVSDRTIANQLASIFRRLGVRSRFELRHRAKESVRLVGAPEAPSGTRSK